MATVTNFFLFNNAYVTSDESVIFSFVKDNPSINNQLVDIAETSTILTRSDQLVSRALAQSPFGIVLASAQTDTQTNHSDPTTIQDDVIVKTNPADTENYSRHGLTQYQIVPGDTLVGIASNFGISPQTIMMENKLNENSVIKPGQELTILPTTGITYTLKQGDTQEAILNKYKISEDAFLDANNIESFEDLDTGVVVVIPLESVNMPAMPKPPTFVKSDTGKVALRQATAPASFVGSPIDFMWPTTVRSITQGFSSRHSGLDISNSKLEPIYAAADGFVEISGYQSNGYGNTVVINHGNGFKTRYGHASELYVSAGDYVKKGQLIAKQGRTGRVRGSTGIHLHFEIIKNGVKVNPLSYARP